MKKENVITIILVLSICGLLLGLFFYNSNRHLTNGYVNRKVELIFNKYTYDDVYKEANNLFFNAIKLINCDFEFEKQDNFINYYAIGNYNNYKRIINFDLVTRTLKTSDIEEYILSNNIIVKDNKYYLGKVEKITSNYIGSQIEIDNFDDQYVYLTSKNYYCDNMNFIGKIENEPDCDYKITNINFKIELDNNNLRINNLLDIKKIY